MAVGAGIKRQIDISHTAGELAYDLVFSKLLASEHKYTDNRWTCGQTRGYGPFQTNARTTPMTNPYTRKATRLVRNLSSRDVAGRSSAGVETERTLVMECRARASAISGDPFPTNSPPATNTAVTLSLPPARLAAATRSLATFRGSPSYRSMISHISAEVTRSLKPSLHNRIAASGLNKNSFISTNSVSSGSRRRDPTSRNTSW